MGQLEKYGLYVLVVVIVMILGIALMGSPSDAVSGDDASRSELATVGTQDISAPAPGGSSTERFGSLFNTVPNEPADPKIEFVDVGPADAVKRDANPPVSGTEGTRPVAGPSGDTLTPSPAVIVRKHKVVAGETPSSISSRYYGTARLYQAILDANPGLDARRMPQGMEIVIPPPPATAAASQTAPRTDVTPIAASSRRHQVAAGETLSSIAARYYGDERQWPRILAANPGLDPNRMRADVSIEVPAPAAGEVSPRPSPRTAPAGGVLHRVVAGETLSSIARRYYGRESDWRRIVDANPGLDDKHLAVGAEIVVPDVVRRA